MALGKSDYGLVQLIGGLNIFIIYFNYILSTSLSRFYSFAIGEEQASKALGFEECRKWFNTAVFIHLTLPLLLFVIGYPIGEYAIRNWLVIPVERINVCVLGFRLSCLNIFTGLATVPFSAMMIAKQHIAEFSGVQIISSIIHVGFQAVMITYPRDWLADYFLMNSMVSTFFALWIAFRSWRIFSECRINSKYMWCPDKLGKLFSYSFWILIGGIGDLFSRQGLVILVNKTYGPEMNASYGIAGTVSAQANQIAGSLNGAFSPAVATACGAKDYAKMRKMAYCLCKVSAILVLVFAIPLFLELPKVIHLWLGNPPAKVIGLCRCMLLVLVLDKLSIGHAQVMRGLGKVVAYQVSTCIILALVVPFAFLLIKLGLSIYSVGYALIFANFTMMLMNIWLSRKRGGLSLSYWLFKIFLPLTTVILLAACCGYSVILLMSQSLLRIICTTIACNGVFLISCWMWVLNQEERSFLRNKARALKNSLLKLNGKRL